MSCADQKPSVPPNVIIIVTDDQGYGDVGFHDNTIIKTPNLDKFSKQAVEFTNFHVGTTCTPTRAGIMTGRNANRNGAWHTIAGASILNADEETIAEVFQQNGYKTGMFGKWHLGDNYPFRPHDRGFDEAFYHGGGGVQQTPDYWNNDYFDDTYFRNGVPEKTEGYCTDVWFDETINFIEKSKEEPFFIYLATNAAHGPFNVPIESMKAYENADLMTHQKRFYGMITNIDTNFGRLTSYLDEKQLTDNTILIFTTDNGTAGGVARNKETQEEFGFNPLRGTKGSHYDGGHMVPFLLRWPDGKIEKMKVDELTAHVDLLPTLTKMCKVPFTPKKELDGLDISRVFKGDKLPERVLITDTQRKQWPEKYRNPSVMKSKWRLVNHKELYNTSNDLSQQDDVADKFPEVVNELQEAYESWWEKVEIEARHSIIPVGVNNNPVEITIHDMHPNAENGEIPWNQNHIRTGTTTTEGYYNIDIKSTRQYQIKLSRWPLHSQLPLNAAVDEIPDQPHLSGLKAGRAITFNKAFFKVEDQVWETAVDNSLSSAELTVDLPQGLTEMSAWFELNDGTTMPAYFITFN
ncbi:MAG: arylsulfatase [Cyclobacteriaceae bacterium]